MECLESYKQTSGLISLDSTGATRQQPPQPIRFFPYYITVIEESHLLCVAADLTKSERRLLDDYRAREGIGDIEGMVDDAGPGDWGGEKYEITVAKHGDKIFQKFKKQLTSCPNQCLR